MAENIADHLNHFVEINKGHIDFLGQIRHWNNLKVAQDSQSVWVKNFTEIQMASKEFLSIPFVTIYTCKDNLLFPKGSLLPSRKLPNFLWTPIERALPIQLSNFNHNFFGVQQTIESRLVPADEEQIASALLVAHKDVSAYISTASAIRLSCLKWVLMDDENALIIGTPMLPVKGAAYWQKGRFLLPAGYRLEFPILENILADKISRDANQLILWNSDNSYVLIKEQHLMPLSIVSWNTSWEASWKTRWKQTQNLD